MKKIDLGQTITILANLGVIVGIAFLAIEMSQNNRLLMMESRLAETEAYVARTSGSVAEWRQLALSGELADLLIRADTEGVSSLSEAERLRVLGWELARLYRFSGNYYQYEQGYLGQETIDDLLRLGAVPQLQLWRDLGIEIDNDSLRMALERLEEENSR